MRWIVIIVFGLWLLAGTFTILRSAWRKWQGPRACHQWLCPQCAVPFGKPAEIRQWQRRKDIMMKSALFSGLVLRCPGCAKDAWFTWAGAYLAPNMRNGFEVVARKWTWNA